MPFTPGCHPIPPDAPLAKAMADARWVLEHARATLHLAHERIVEGLADGRDHAVLEDAAAATIGVRVELVEAAELVDQVASQTYDPEHGHTGTVTDHDRADLERGRQRAWAAELTATAIIDSLGTPAGTPPVTWPT